MFNPLLCHRRIYLFSFVGFLCSICTVFFSDIIISFNEIFERNFQILKKVGNDRANHFIFSWNFNVFLREKKIARLFCSLHCCLCWKLWSMPVCTALLTRPLSGGCSRTWRGVPRPLVCIRSAHVPEPGSRVDEERVWGAEGQLSFSGARIGAFFQDRPALKNPFLEDAFLRGYLSRHLPEQVRRNIDACKV